MNPTEARAECRLIMEARKPGNSGKKEPKIEDEFAGFITRKGEEGPHLSSANSRPLSCRRNQTSKFLAKDFSHLNSWGAAECSPLQAPTCGRCGMANRGNCAP